MSGPDLICRWLRADLHPRAARAATPSSTTRPTTATRTRRTTASSFPVVDDDGEHRFTALVKAHRPDMRQLDADHLLWATLPRRLRRGRADLPVRADPARLQRRRRHHPHVPCADPRPGAVVGRLPRLWSARRGSASARCSSSAREIGWDALDAFAAAGSTTASSGWSAAIRRMPAGGPWSRASTTPLPGCARTASGQGDGRRSTPGEARIEVDLRDNLDCLPCGLNLTEATARTAAMIGVFNSLPIARAARTRAASGGSRCSSERTASSVSRATRELLDRDHRYRRSGRQRDPARDRRARRRLRHGRDRSILPAPSPSSSGTTRAATVPPS